MEAQKKLQIHQLLQLNCHLITQLKSENKKIQGIPPTLNKMTNSGSKYDLHIDCTVGGLHHNHQLWS